MAFARLHYLHSILGLLLKERQIYFRTDGEVRFLTVGKLPQLAAAVSAVISLVWIGFTTGEYFTAGAVIANKEAHIADLHATRQMLLSEMDKRERQYAAVAHKIEEKHRRLSLMLKQKAELKSSLNSLNSELRLLRQKKKPDAEKIDELNAMIARQRRALETIAGQEQRLSRDLNASSQVLAVLQQENNQEKKGGAKNRDRIVAALDGLERQLVSHQSEAYDLRLSLQEREKQLSRMAAENATAIAAREALEVRVQQLEHHLNRLSAAQRHLVFNVVERTDESIEELQSVLALTGLDHEVVMKRFQNATGGPFEQLLPDLTVAAGEPTAGDRSGRAVLPVVEQRFAQTLLRLDDRLDQWQALNRILQHLPLATPVDHYHVTSRFGRRRDPFTKRWAFHSGMDLAGSRRQTVYATAGGKVTFAGTRGPYGRMVEIDHGYGLKTRYGHLHAIKVKRGQTVTFRQKIGLLGSTGRSSGPHVHYEIHFDGKPVNPANFVKAGKHVFKS